jgi:hypothetical protein
MARAPWFHCACVSIVVAGMGLVACSSKSSGGGQTSSCASPGGPAPGPADDHCGSTVQVVDQSACAGSVDAGAGDDGGAAGDDGGAADAGDIGNCGDPGFGAAMYGQSGADDDCKYDVSWTSDPLCENQSVYFTVTATYRSDHSPLTGATPYPDIVLDCTHPVPNTPAPASPSPEISPGVYRIGPVAFDKPGRWVVRFHFYGTCNDLPQSPHGHAAFWVDVP